MSMAEVTGDRNGFIRRLWFFLGTILLRNICMIILFYALLALLYPTVYCKFVSVSRRLYIFSSSSRVSSRSRGSKSFVQIEGSVQLPARRLGVSLKDDGPERKWPVGV